MTPIDRHYAKALTIVQACAAGRRDCNAGITTVPCRYARHEHPRAYVLQLAHDLLAEVAEGPLLEHARTLEQTS